MSTQNVEKNSGLLIKLRALITLTKPRIAVMVLVATSLGFLLAETESWDFTALSLTLLGTLFAGGGASVLNQFLERDVDALMERTKNRPLPAGILTPQTALYYGVVFSVGGPLFLLWQVNILAAFLALLSTFLYVLVYTPMKRVSWINTTVGAIPGAIPPLIGWAGATGSLSWPAWILFGVLFIWQHPHFFAIAWIYREDYARGGMKMLPVVKPDGKAMFTQGLLFSVLLIPVSLIPQMIGMSGFIYSIGAALLGLGLLLCGVIFSRQKTEQSARLVLRASLLYLPLLMIFILADALV